MLTHFNMKKTIITAILMQAISITSMSQTHAQEQQRQIKPHFASTAAGQRQTHQTIKIIGYNI